MLIGENVNFLVTQYNTNIFLQCNSLQTKCSFLAVKIAVIRFDNAKLLGISICIFIHVELYTDIFEYFS